MFLLLEWVVEVLLLLLQYLSSYPLYIKWMLQAIELIMWSRVLQEACVAVKTPASSCFTHLDASVNPCPVSVKVLERGCRSFILFLFFCVFWLLFVFVLWMYFFLCVHECVNFISLHVVTLSVFVFLPFQSSKSFCSSPAAAVFSPSLSSETTSFVSCLLFFFKMAFFLIALFYYY